MATKAQLEAELKELKKAHEELKSDAEAAFGVLQDTAKENDRLKTKLEEALSFEPEGDRAFLTPEVKERLQALKGFLHKLYRESEWPPVRQDIQDWRELLGKLTE